MRNRLLNCTKTHSVLQATYMVNTEYDLFHTNSYAPAYTFTPSREHLIIKQKLCSCGSGFGDLLFYHVLLFDRDMKLEGHLLSVDGVNDLDIQTGKQMLYLAYIRIVKLYLSRLYHAKLF